MAGIGFELRKLTQRDDLLGILQAYAHSAVISTGPWLFTILSLGGIVLYGSLITSHPALTGFRLIIIYNFAVSLVMSGPVIMMATRLLADMIYQKNVAEAPSLMLGSLVLLYATQAPVVVPFYLYYADLSWGTRLAALATFFLITGIWLVSVFLTALKDYKSITRSFALGMLLGTAGAAALAMNYSVAGMLLGFGGGLAYIFFSLVSRIFAEYPYPVSHPFRFLRQFRPYWHIAAGGLLYNAAIWVDKWVMWFSPDREVMPSGMVSYPDYDGAMFLAYLSIVPSMAAFVLQVETDFFEKYIRFYQDIQRRAPYAQIQKNHAAVLQTVLGGLRNLIVLQGSICLVTVLLAPRIFETLGFSFVQLGMFRLGVMGAFFHVLLLVLTIVLSYFDLRRETLAIDSIFLVTNLSFTYASMKMGFPYYGYGYFLSTLVTFLFAFLLAMHYTAQLPYQTFVRNNASLR